MRWIFSLEPVWKRYWTLKTFWLSLPSRGALVILLIVAVMFRSRAHIEASPEAGRPLEQAA